jgi:hypothetical protein
MIEPKKTAILIPEHFLNKKSNFTDKSEIGTKTYKGTKKAISH